MSHQVGRKARVNAAMHSKIHFKRKRGQGEHCCPSFAGCECVQALAGEQRAKMLGESDRERKLHDTSTTAIARKAESKTVNACQGRLKRQDETCF